MICDGGILLWIGFDAMPKDNKAKKHAPRDPEDAFLGVQFDVLGSERSEGLIEVSYQIIRSFSFDYDVIYVSLNGPPDEVPKNGEHTVLVCGPRVFEAKRHGYIVVSSERSDERSRELVGLFHHDLMVTGVSIKEGKSLTSRSRVNYLIDTW
jgi:hypothetical protein